MLHVHNDRHEHGAIDSLADWLNQAVAEARLRRGLAPTALPRRAHKSYILYKGYMTAPETSQRRAK